MSISLGSLLNQTVHYPPPPGLDLQDGRFLQLMTDLQPYGGMLPSEDVRSIGFVTQAGFSLGEALMRRDLFGLTWRHRLWLPMFQFEMPGWTLSPKVSSVARHMHPSMQGFELAEWFVSRSPWLHDRCPLEVIETDSMQVHDAAQADRFLFAG